MFTSFNYNFWAEWELAEKVDFDGKNKLIIVYPHVTDLDIRQDVWSAWVRWNDMEARGYDRFLLAMDRTGLEPIPGGQTGDSYFLKNGWKLIVDFSKVAITGILYSRDYDSAYFTPEEVLQKPATVSALVNTVTTIETVVTGDLSTVPADVWADPKAVQLIEDISLLDKAVHIDTEKPTNGNGSQENPFNSLGSALDYAENRGLKLLHVLADITIDRNLKNFVITGIGTPAIDCNGHDLDKSEFTHCVMKGLYSGTITVQESVLYNGVSLNGFFENCVLAGDLLCVNNSKVLIKNCASFIQGLQQPSISMVAGGTCELGVRFYSGGLELRDLNHASDLCSLEPNAGALTLAASCTIGTGLSLKGVGTLVNNSSIANGDISNQLLNPDAILDEIA